MKPGKEPMLVLIWNLFHGRSVPGAGRDLREPFAARIAGWEWDVALLQEVPPWWPRPLALAAGSSGQLTCTMRGNARTHLTSDRNLNCFRCDIERERQSLFCLCHCQRLDAGRLL